MLFCNHANNVFRREIHMNIRTALFQKLMEDREYSEDEKITMLTQDMEFLGDNFFERYMSISCWGIWSTDYGDLYHCPKCFIGFYLCFLHNLTSHSTILDE